MAPALQLLFLLPKSTGQPPGLARLPAGGRRPPAAVGLLLLAAPSSRLRALLCGSARPCPAPAAAKAPAVPASFAPHLAALPPRGADGRVVLHFRCGLLHTRRTHQDKKEGDAARRAGAPCSRLKRECVAHWCWAAYSSSISPQSAVHTPCGLEGFGGLGFRGVAGLLQAESGDTAQNSLARAKVHATHTHTRPFQNFCDPFGCPTALSPSCCPPSAVCVRDSRQPRV